MKIQIGKYTIKFLHLKTRDIFDYADIICGKTKYRIKLSLYSVMSTESDIAHILKVERMKRKRELAALEKLLSEGD